eukprot:scpid30063/ scgid11278/ Ankyrin-1; Erythrocyte ankyrin
MPATDALQQQLQQACKEGNVAKVQELVRIPEIKVDFPDQNGLTALQHALFHGYHKVAKVLFEGKSSSNHLAKDDVAPIHTAALGGSVECVRLAAQYGADLDAVTKEGLTALHYAADGRPDVARELLDLKAKVDIPTKHIGYTPLHKATFGGHVEIVELLLDANANVHSQNINGNTALHVACREGYVNVAQVLVDSGATLQAKNKGGKTPRQLAEEDRQLEVLSWVDSLSSEHGPMELVCAIEDCMGGGIDNHLSFKEGDFITVVKKPYEDWWIGKVGDGPEGMFCILMVDTRPLDPSEGIVTPDMVAEQEASKGRVCRETDKLMGQASTTVALRQELQKINTMPMLTDKAAGYDKVPDLATDARKKYSAIKAQLAAQDKGPGVAAGSVNTLGKELVLSAMQSHERQSSKLRERISMMQTAGEVSREQVDQLMERIRENSTKMMEWKNLVTTCPEALVFCTRLFCKMAEFFIGMKALRLALQMKTRDHWAKSSCGIKLLDQLVPMPGFSMILEHSEGSLSLSRARILDKVKNIAALVPHMTSTDEICIGTALAVVHAYINQIKQLTTVGAAMLADGACMQMLEYLIHDCPDPKGTMVTIEALSRSVVFARRGNDTARWLKSHHLPLHVPDPQHTWTINGVFRETGVRTPDGKKHRGRDTNTDIYGYRNGSYLEAKELCMALAGQEHTLGPRRGKILHSTMTHNLFKRPSQREQEAVQRRQAARSRFQAGLRSKTVDVPGVSARTGGGGVFGQGRSAGGIPVGGKSPTTGRRGTAAAAIGRPASSPLTAKKAGLGGGDVSPAAGGPGGAAAAGGKDVGQLTATIAQLQAGSELGQAQLKAMYDQMCALSAQVDQLKGQGQ